MLKNLLKMIEVKTKISRTSSMSTGAGISDYLTSPASLAGHKPKPDEPKKVSKHPQHPQRLQPQPRQHRQQRHSIVIDGRMKKVVTQFTEEGGVIQQVTF